MTAEEKKDLKDTIRLWTCRCCRLSKILYDNGCKGDAAKKCDAAEKKLRELIDHEPTTD